MKKGLLTGVKMLAGGVFVACLFLLFVTFMTLEKRRPIDPISITDMEFQAIELKLRAYFQFAGELPSEDLGLNALRERPSSLEKGKHWFQTLRKDTSDIWGKEIRYEVSEKRVTLTSAGPDRMFETVDDLNHLFAVDDGDWEEEFGDKF